MSAAKIATHLQRLAGAARKTHPTFRCTLGSRVRFMTREGP